MINNFFLFTIILHFNYFFICRVTQPPIQLWQPRNRLKTEEIRNSLSCRSPKRPLCPNASTSSSPRRNSGNCRWLKEKIQTAWLKNKWQNIQTESALEEKLTPPAKAVNLELTESRLCFGGDSEDVIVIDEKVPRRSSLWRHRLWRHHPEARR